MIRHNFTSSEKDRIIHLYVDQHLGTVEVGKRVGVSRTVIKRILLSKGIEIRNSSDCHIGQHPWNKGKKWSDEVKEKIRLKSQNRFGEKNPNWRGGEIRKRDLRRNLKIAKLWNKSCLDRDGHKCLWCGSTHHLQVHHIIPLRDIKDMELFGDINNGITLCSKCHDKTRYYEHKYISIFHKLLKNHVNSGKTSQETILTQAL